MKKVILSLFLLFFLTGCTAEYKLDIDNTSVKETILINIKDSKLGLEGKNILKNSKQKVFNDSSDYYIQNFNKSGNKFNINYNYVHDIDKFSGTSFIEECYPEYSIINNQDVLVINTGEEFVCYNKFGNEKIENTKIVISTKLNVLNNNADKINGNRYIWNIDESNYYDKPIIMKIDKSNANNESTFLLGIISLIIIIVGVLIYLFVKFKRIKNNSI